MQAGHSLEVINAIYISRIARLAYLHSSSMCSQKVNIFSFESSTPPMHDFLSMPLQLVHDNNNYGSQIKTIKLGNDSFISHTIHTHTHLT